MKVWQEHKGQKPTDQYDLFYDPLTLPIVDFDHYMVIAIFQGTGWNNAGVTVVEIVEEDNSIILRFANKYYQTGGTDGGGQRTTAYGLFVLPRSKKPIILEENVQHNKGNPPIWKECIKFSEI